jgi:hypothetical protein
VKDELSEAAQALKKRKRRLHLFDFQFEELAGVVGIRVPTAEDSLVARLQAARDASKRVGPDVQSDDNSVVVDQATLNLLSHVCRDPKDPDGIPLFGPPSLMARTLRAHEIVQLLGFLEEARRREDPEGEWAGDDLDAIVDLLEVCSRDEAAQALANLSRGRLVGLCWELAQRLGAAGTEDEQPTR